MKRNKSSTLFSNFGIMDHLGFPPFRLLSHFKLLGGMRSNMLVSIKETIQRGKAIFLGRNNLTARIALRYRVKDNNQPRRLESAY